MRSLFSLSLVVVLAASVSAGPQTFGKPLQGLAPTTLAAILEKTEAG